MDRRRALGRLLPLLLVPPLLSLGSPRLQAQPQPTARLLELNTASRAQLESLRGLGPALVERLLQARGQALFSDWADLRQRVPGLGPTLLRRLSAQGLRVAGQALPGSDRSDQVQS